MLWPFGVITDELVYQSGDIVKSLAISDEGRRDIFSFYIQDKFKINRQWSATYGARYDNYSDFGNSINPRFSLIFRPNGDSSYKFIYGEAFRAPSIRQLKSLFTGNTSLQPEKIKTVELAWLQQSHTWQSTLTWYFSRHSNLINTEPRVNGLGRQYQNSNEKLDTAGWEIEAFSTPFDGLSIRVAYSYVYKTEENPRRFPRGSFSFITNYQFKNTNYNFNGYYHSEVQQPVRNENISLDSVWILNTAVKHNINKKLAILAEIQNMLDKDYYSSVKGIAFKEGLFNRGRTFQLGMQYTF